MPTNLDLDPKLVAEALRVSGLRTKKAVVEEGLRALIRFHQQADLRRLRGMLPWQDPDPRSAEDTGAAAPAPAKPVKGKGKAGAGPR